MIVHEMTQSTKRFARRQRAFSSYSTIVYYSIFKGISWTFSRLPVNGGIGGWNDPAFRTNCNSNLIIALVTRTLFFVQVCTRTYALTVSGDKTRPMQCRGKVHRCTMRSRGTRVERRERERERKRYRIVDYLKCIGNKPRRVTRRRPSTGPARLVQRPRYRAIRLKVVSSSRISGLTDGGIYTERGSKLSSTDATEDLAKGWRERGDASSGVAFNCEIGGCRTCDRNY